MSDLCTRHLLREHREVESGMKNFEQFLVDQASLDVWGTREIEDFATIQDYFHLHLHRHLRKEDEVLFPALEGFLPRDLGPLAVLRGEHEDVRELYRRVKIAGEARMRPQACFEARAQLEHYSAGMMRVLRDHIYKEDRILFPMVTRFLTPERDAELLRQMEALHHNAAAVFRGAPPEIGR